MFLNITRLRSSLLLFLALSCSVAAYADVKAVMSERKGLGANDLGDIVWDGSTIWVSGSGTLTKKLWGDGRLVSDWYTYSGVSGFGIGSMGALFATEDIIIMSWIYTDDRNGDYVTTGDGFSLSYDRGESWEHVTILDLFPERSDLYYPGAWTSTYDFAFSEGSLYASTTAGFLLRSDNLGMTWENIIPPPDSTLVFSNPNHHGQCVDAYGDTLWVGTFKGMNVSFDRGETWTNYSWPGDGAIDPDNPMPGDFCYTVEHNVVGGKTHVWVGCSPYYGNGKYGICHTVDGGVTWEYMTTNYNAWNFAFGNDSASNPKISESTVFASSDSGLVVSYNLGDSWSVIPIAEPDSIVTTADDGTEVVSAFTGESWEADTRVYGLYAAADTLWVTSSDGLAMSPDWGDTWEIFKGVRRVRTIDNGARNVGISSLLDSERTYAFPNPFSPGKGGQGLLANEIAICSHR